MNIAINGFGRIGKNLLRIIMEDTKACQFLTVKAINVGPSDIAAVAHFFKYDTLLGTYSAKVALESNILIIEDKNGDFKKINIIAEKNISKVNWADFSIDWVVDASGKFTDRINAQKHLDSGAQHVLITAPAKNEDITIIPGVNHQSFDKNQHKIVSLGSCTTNAVVPILHVLDAHFSLEQAYMTTVHAYTNSQALLDVDATSKDLRKKRAAALNIVPTTTGAMEVVDKILPNLKGKIFGGSLRVPVSTVSIVDLTFILKKDITIEILHEAFEKASASYFKNIMALNSDALVSCDFKGNPHSVIIDTLLTQATKNTGKIFGWYDNEWGYSMRLKDFLISVS